MSADVETIISIAQMLSGPRTFAPVLAKIGPVPHYAWCVAAARRYSGLTNKRGYRQLVAGPFDRKAKAASVARELRTGLCAIHDDCAESERCGDPYRAR